MNASSQRQTQGGGAEALGLWRDGLEAFRLRDYDRAAGLMQALLADHGDVRAGLDSASVHLQLGVTLLRLGRTEEGVAELMRSVKLDPYSGRARYKLGVGLARLGRNEEALQSLEEAVRLSPDVADHQWRFAEELRRQGYYREASEAAREALELDPGHAEARDTLKALRERTWWLRLFWRMHPTISRAFARYSLPLRRKPADVEAPA